MKTISIPSVQARRNELEAQFTSWPRHTLAQHFEAACRKYADRPYIYTDGVFLSFSEIWEKAVQLAKSLLKLGVNRRDHIAVLMENDPDYVALYIAAAMVGAVTVPINTMLKKDEIAYILEQSDSRFLILHQKIKKILHVEVIEELLNDKDSSLSAEIKEIVCIKNTEAPVSAAFTSWDDFTAGAGKISEKELESRQSESLYPDEIAVILYTSGSTGKPKGVMLSHDMLLRCAYATCLSRAVEDGRVTYAPLPFYHCYNLVEGILAMSFTGGALIAPPVYTPLSALQLMEKFKANDFLCVPSMFVPLLNQPDISTFNLEHLYAVWIGAAPAPVSVWEKGVELLGLKEICTGYGQTEISSSGVITEMGDPIERIITRVGRPKLGGNAGLPEYNGSIVEYRTIDVDTLKMLPPGKIGELVVRGNTVTNGYYKKPDETAETIDKDGWLRTGDVGRIDENGYIELLGRSKELYKVSGELVAPKEIEDVINKHEAVAQAYVVGVKNKITTEAGAAFVELKEGMPLSAKEILDLCAAQLARFKVPRHVWFMKPEEWPKTSTGKVRKNELREIAEKRLAEHTAK